MKKNILLLVIAFCTAVANPPAASGPPKLMLRLDDNGMNLSVTAAIRDVAETGIPFSTSVMFTCPWYQKAVEVLQQHPNLSVGVHLVLNSEWKYYKWGPVLGKIGVPSLVDDNGYFLASTDGFLQSPYKLAEVEKELTAQMERAMHSGLKIDYVDYHMWTAISTPELRAIVEKIAKKYRVGISRYFGEEYQSMFDVSVEMKRQEFFKRLQTLPHDSVNLLVMHVAQDTPEMRALIDMNDPDQHSETEPVVALHRSSELKLLLSDEFQKLAKNGAIRLITYRDLISSQGLEHMKAPEE